MNKRKKTMIAVATGAVVIAGNYLGVNYFINRGIDPVSVIYTAKEIPAGTKITEEMLIEKTVPRQAIPNNAVFEKEDVVGKFTNQGYGLSQYSLVFKDNVLKEGDMPNSAVLKLQDKERAFPLLVDLETSLGNSILPDSRVDLAFRGEVAVTETVDGLPVTTKKPIYGVIAKDVRVTSVKDSEAGAVFNDQDTAQDQGKEQSKDKNSRPLAKIYTFAVNEEINELLNKATLLGDVRPIAKGEEVSETALSEDEIVSWINENSFKYQNKVAAAE